MMVYRRYDYLFTLNTQDQGGVFRSVFREKDSCQHGLIMLKSPTKMTPLVSVQSVIGGEPNGNTGSRFCVLIQWKTWRI